MQDSSIFVKCVHCVAKVKNPDYVITSEGNIAEYHLSCLLAMYSRHQ